MPEETTVQYDEKIPAVPDLKHYACYRTQPLGWQEAGYIVVTSDVISVDRLPTAADDPDLWTNTAWVADPEHKYRMSHTYPELVYGGTGTNQETT